jgi:preprotein translocase subunit YajC
MDTDNNDVRLVGKKSNWPLLLIALLVLALLGYMLWASAKGNQQDDRQQDDQQAQQMQEGDTDVQDIAGIYAIANASELHNQNLDLEDVTVASVVSDRLFYVHQGNPDQLLLVHLAEDLDEGTTEQRVQVMAGQRLSISGELKDVSQQDIEVGDEYTEAEAQTARGERVYLHANEIESQ